MGPSGILESRFMVVDGMKNQYETRVLEKNVGSKKEPTPNFWAITKIGTIEKPER